MGRERQNNNKMNSYLENQKKYIIRTKINYAREERTGQTRWDCRINALSRAAAPR